MGNRATFSYADESLGFEWGYVQWNGGIDSILCILECAKLESQRHRLPFQMGTWDCFLEALHHFTEDQGVTPIWGSRAKMEGSASYDNGHYTVSPDWTLTQYPEGYINATDPGVRVVSLHTLKGKPTLQRWYEFYMKEQGQPHQLTLY
jgi:hypothetical protein